MGDEWDFDDGIFMGYPELRERRGRAAGIVIQDIMNGDDRDDIWDAMEEWTDQKITSIADACEKLSRWGLELLRERADATAYDREMALNKAQEGHGG